MKLAFSGTLLSLCHYLPRTTAARVAACALLTLPAALAVDANIAAVQSVYVLPMSGRLDLYIAEWLARGNAIQVTTDPKSAGAVLTDRLGDDFERKMNEMFAKPKESASDPAAVAHRYGSGATHGTIFLVDAKTRRVLWSDYEKPPAYRTSGNLNKEAERIAKKLEADLSKRQ